MSPSLQNSHYRLPSFPGESDHLILCISMYRGLVMQEEEENQIFLHPRYRGINEKLKFHPSDEPLNHRIDPNERVDQMANFFMLTQMQWRDLYHDFKVMGSFIISIMKIFEFKVELCIHDLVCRKKEICLVQAGFIEESEEESAPVFSLYQRKDFPNKTFSTFLKSFFSSRGLSFEWLRKMPEDFRIDTFLEEDREDLQLYGVYLYVNKGKFLKDFEKEEDGLFVLKKIMDEFYSELDHLFEIRNAIVSNPAYQSKVERAKEGNKRLKKDKRRSFYMKADRDQFFIRWDWKGVELLDFVHLKIWYHPDEPDIEEVIIAHLPDLEFDYAACSKKEYEKQKERLSYVL